MNKISKAFLSCVYSILCLSVQAQDQTTWTNDFSNTGEKLKTVGRGTCSIADNVFRSQNAYALFGKPEWKNYTFSFKARAPKNADQVQIWASFRNYNRFDRYVVGIKGGLQDDLYLMRTGYMGTDEFMGVRPLGFHPVPGEWYRMKVEVCGNRIRIFLNDEEQPHIDITDNNANLVPLGAARFRLLLRFRGDGGEGVHRRREHNGHPAAVDGAHCHTLRGQIGGKPGSGVQSIRTGASEARRDEGGILADVLVFQGPAVCRVYHLHRGGLAVVRPLRRVNGVI